MQTATSPLHAFRKSIEDFLDETGMVASKFGELACKDPSFVSDMRAGREPRFTTIGRVEAFMAEWRTKHGIDAANSPNDGVGRPATETGVRS